MIGLALLLPGCTALKVVTHSTDTTPLAAPAGQYRLDPHHWSVSFDVDHLGYARFVLRFDQVTADLDWQPDSPERSQVSASISAASIDSNDAALDALLRGPDLLDAAAYPTLLFVSRSLRRSGPASGEMTGDLTLVGQTRPVTLQVTFNGAAPNPLTGDDTMGFSASGVIDRASFGLARWYPAVGNDLRLRIEAEFIRVRPGS